LLLECVDVNYKKGNLYKIDERSLVKTISAAVLPVIEWEPSFMSAQREKRKVGANALKDKYELSLIASSLNAEEVSRAQLGPLEFNND